MVGDERAEAQRDEAAALSGLGYLNDLARSHNGCPMPATLFAKLMHALAGAADECDCQVSFYLRTDYLVF